MARVGGLTFVTSVLGFGRELAFAHVFGATQSTDAYLVALSVPTFVYVFLVGSGLNVAIVPVLSEWYSMDEREAVKKYQAFLRVMLIIAAGVTCVLVAFPASLATLLSPAVAAAAETQSYVRWLAPIFILSVWAYCEAALLCVLGKPQYWTIVGLVQNIAVVAAILIVGPWFGVPAAIFGTTLGTMAAAAWLAWINKAARVGGHTPNAADYQAGLRLGSRLLPFALCAGVGGSYGTMQIDVFLARYFASSLRPGSITLLALGNKLMAFPVILLGSALGLITLSAASRARGEGRQYEAAQHLIAAAGLAAMLVAPVCVIYFFQSEELVRLAFGGSAMTEKQLMELGNIVRGYSGAIVGLTFVYIMSSFAAACGRQRALIACGIGGMAVNATLMQMLSHYMGTAGISAAISTGSIIYTLMLGTIVHRDLAGKRWGPTRDALGLVVVGAVMMSLTILGIGLAWPAGRGSAMGLLLKLATGIVVYGLFLTMCRKVLAEQALVSEAVA